MSAKRLGSRVAVVGAGPTGLVLATMLLKHGVRAAVYEQHAATSTLPGAHVVNVRTCEILRELGLFEAAAARAAPFESMRHISWRENLSGRIFGKLALYGDEGMTQRRLCASPVRALNLAQDRLEALLLEHFTNQGGEVCFGHKITDASQRDRQAVLTIENQDSGVTHEQAFDYVIACDGARSSVRRRLGIEMEGPASLAQFVSIYFESDLAPFMRETSGPVHFLSGHAVRGAVIGFDLERQWALMCVVPSADVLPEEPAARLEFADRLVRLAMGSVQRPYRIVSVGKWNMSAQVARAFRQGSFFLAGDAAHRFPPTGGLGLNTGAADAHNLAWKLAAVMHGWASPALLDTYEAERRAIAIDNCEQSTKNARRMEIIATEIGASALSPIDLEAIGKALSKSEVPRVPPHTPEQQERIDAAIEGEREHFDSLRIELGYRYSAEGSGLSLRSSAPHTVGMRLPHAWLKGEAAVRSTLDIGGGNLFVLLTGAGQRGWAAAFKEIAAARHIPFTVAFVDDFSMNDETWRGLAGIGKEGALLVRPDGHIGWATSDDLPDEGGMNEILDELTRVAIQRAEEKNGEAIHTD